MKNIENNIKKLQSSVHNNVRNHSLAIINSLLSFKSKNNSIHHRLIKLVQCTKQFLKKKPKYYFYKSWQRQYNGSMDKNFYTDKINAMLIDQKSQKFQKILVTKSIIVWETYSGWKKFISGFIYKKFYLVMAIYPELTDLQRFTS